MQKIVPAFIAGVLLCGGMVIAVARPWAEALPDCAIGTPDHPADWRKCKGRIVHGAAKPEPYPVRPDLVGPGKP